MLGINVSFCNNFSHGQPALYHCGDLFQCIFFTNTNVQKDGSLFAPKNIVKPNSYVVLEAIIDTICIVSSCPFDINPNGWEINANGVVTELEVEI